jgi:hypothetical protein
MFSEGKMFENSFQIVVSGMNYKRKHYLSKTMRKCHICGSQRRLKDKSRKEDKIREVIEKELIYLN